MPILVIFKIFFNFASGYIVSAIKTFLPIILKYWRESLIIALLAFSYSQVNNNNKKDIRLDIQENEIASLEGQLLKKQALSDSLLDSIKTQNDKIDDLILLRHEQATRIDNARNTIADMDNRLIEYIDRISDNSINNMSCNEVIDWMADVAKDIPR